MEQTELFPGTSLRDARIRAVRTRVLTGLFRSLLDVIDPSSPRAGTDETPDRVAKAWQEWTSGYAMDTEELLKTFDDGAQGYSEMVTVKDIPFYSHCEHHLAPFFGTATVSYIPDGKIVGLSKLSRLVNAHARRLQVQERITVDVATDIWTHLKPKGVGVILKARHLCMESRGVCQQGHHTVTTSLFGVYKADPSVRDEFLRA